MILIYNDLGVSSNCLTAIIDLFKQHFPQYQIILTNSDQFLSYQNKTKLLVIPGGADIPYCQKLNGDKTNKIREFVYHGGAYLGICAGAYFGCKNIIFQGDGYKIIGERELAFLPATAIGSLSELTQGVYFNDKANSKAVVKLSDQSQTYYHGGCYFEYPDINDLENNPIIQQLNYDVLNKPALIHGRFGKGQFLLSGVHFEVTQKRYKKFELDLSANNANIEKQIFDNLPKKDNPNILAMLKTMLENAQF